MGQWSDFRYEPLAEVYDVGICPSAEGCKRGYSQNKHLFGYADGYGTIHWHRWHSSPTTKRGLHKLLSHIAVVKLQQRRRKGLPQWKALHEAEVWAQTEAQERFRLRFPMEYSSTARKKAREDVKRNHVPTRTIDMAAYQWMHAEAYKENRRNK
jgi:hypothetical protein